MKFPIPHAKVKLLAGALVLFLCSLAAPVAFGQTSLTAFTISTTPSGTLPGGSQLQINMLLTGTPTSGPSGSVDAFTSSAANCSVKSADIATQALIVNPPATSGGDYTASATMYIYTVPTGTYYVCAAYLPDTNSTFAAATTNPGTPLTAYAATTLTVVQQTFPVAGQPAPTGTITVYDSGNNVVGTASVTASGISPDPVTITLPDPIYSVQYSGDAVYGPQYYYGTAYFSNALASISPAAIPAGSPDTTLTVNGNGFVSGPTGSTGSTGSSIQFTSSTGTSQVFTTTYVSSHQLTAVIPQALLATPQAASIQVVNSSGSSNAATLNIYQQQSTSSTVSGSTPTSITYGQMSAATLGASVATASPTAVGFPTGALNFTLTGPGSGATQLALGAATLASSGGIGSFLPGQVNTVTDIPPSLAITADLNGDGRTDIVSMPSIGINDFPPPYLQVFLAGKADSFQSEMTVPTSCSPTNFAVGDINGDGKPDLVALCGFGSGGVIATYMLGNGDGTFQAPVPFLSGTTLQYPDHIVIGDFNGDGVMDVALVDDFNGLVQVFTGSKAFGTFTALPASSIPSSSGGFTSPVAADFNQDGKTDFVMLQMPSQQASATLELLTSNGDGTFTSQLQSFATPAFSFQTPVVTDVNGDGYPDVAIADPGLSTSSTDTGQVLVFQNNGSGTLNAPISYPLPNASMITGVPFPVIGKPSTTITQPWSIFAGATNPTTEAITLTGLSVAGGTIAPVYSGLAGGYDITSYGGQNLLVSGDFNGNGFDDIGVIAAIAANTPTAYLTPHFYTNSSTASLTGITQQPNVGTYNLTANYNGDVIYTSSTSPNYAITITQATPTAVLTGTATTYFGLNATYTATVTGVPNGTIPSGTVTFYANNAAISGAIPLVAGASSATAQFTTSSLAVGSYTVDAVYSGDTNYVTTSTNAVTTQVQAGSILTAIQPSSGNLGDPATTITLTGAGFLPTSVAQINGTALTTTYVSPTTLTAVIPASFFTTVQAASVTVATPGEPVSSALPFNVIAPAALATFTGPSSASSGSQPSLSFQLSQAYPVTVTATFTLSVQPATSSGITDPAVQFASGGSTYTVTIPANSTAPVPVQLQTGTLAGTITVTASLSAGGTDITPASLQPVIIQVPQSPPVLTSVSIVRSGTTLTVTVQGYSSTREVQSANFHFTSASGALLANSDVTVQLNAAFANWYAQTISDQYGSAFSYTQSFTLSQDASTIGSVSVTLTNSVGVSNTESAQ